MRIPISSPTLDLASLPRGRLMEIIARQIGPLADGKYRHWDTLRHRTPPEGLTLEEWWVALKFARRVLYKKVPLVDATGAAFQYAPVEPMYQMLHEIDKNATGSIGAPDQVVNPDTRDYYLIRSLMEEAITSSQLEGAATSRSVAKEMLTQGRKPRDRNEQMIYNNYEAVQFIREVRKEALTPSLVIETQKILTRNAITEPDASGRLRRSDEPIHVVDDQGRVLFVPPPADQLDWRLEAMCAFANDSSDGKEAFFHPVLRSVLLHFWLAYDHPFVDGNGRTARALFYWSMARQNYWLAEFLSISRILRTAPARYARSFLYTETDENDLTYFILSQLGVICLAIEQLMSFLDLKAKQMRETRQLLQEAQRISGLVNHRQLALLAHALDHPGAVYTIATHMRSHNVSHQTARNDLIQLAKFTLLDQGKVSRHFEFRVPEGLRERVKDLAGTRTPRRVRRRKAGIQTRAT